MPRSRSLVLAILLAGMTAKAAPPDEALPHVRVKNIGLHVGGGPNDAATKGPFLKAIAARFDDFRRCYGKIETAREKGTFGIDLLVPKEGGHAETSNPRTAMKGDAFRACIVEVFEGVAFDPPKRGATKLSYALAFEPE